MKKVLAVSGGVDSVVMMDLMLRRGLSDSSGVNNGFGIYHGTNNADTDYSPDEIIVAHFDHGMRENSREDAEFVRRIAQEKGVRFVTKRAELGEATSEAEAREARYEFLREVAGLDGVIYTAHHLDDLVETVAINCLRGTGWRGLAGMSQAGVRRPLLEAEMIFEPMDKMAIFEYAAKRGLHYREDQTNSWDAYLRNRIRHGTNNLDFEAKLKIFELWQRQQEIRVEADRIVTSLLPESGQAWRREWFQGLERLIALELLRAGTLRAGISATRPQLEDFRQAILHYAPGKQFNLPGDRLVKFSKEEFEL